MLVGDVLSLEIKVFYRLFVVWSASNQFGTVTEIRLLHVHRCPLVCVGASIRSECRDRKRERAKDHLSTSPAAIPTVTHRVGDWGCLHCEQQ